MKDIFIRFCRWALTVLGITAVGSCEQFEPVAEYGCPTMTFRVSGKIVDSITGKPIKGIAVSCDDDWDNPEVITSENGEFVYESYAFPKESIVLKFTDSDDDANGLYFMKEIEVKLTQSKPGASTWDSGLYVADDMNVKLDEEVAPMYGTPFVEFSVKGRVVDADSNPIPNIEVTWAGNMYGKAVTAEDGSFEYTNEDIGTDMTDVVLTFTDVDGEDNGGDFETEDVQVPLTQTDPGDGEWDFGEYSANDVVVVLDRKSTDEIN